MTTCPDCHGSGYAPYQLFNIKTREVLTVTREQYYGYPADEDAAYDAGEFLCRMPREYCPTCCGDGQILED